MGDVVTLGNITTLDIDPAQVLDGAAHLNTVIVMGYDEDGEEYFASSITSRSDILWLTERFRIRVLTDE